MTTENVQHDPLALEVVRVMGEVLRPKDMLLFGSRGRGDWNENSDIDALAIFDGEHPGSERYQETLRAGPLQGTGAVRSCHRRGPGNVLRGTVPPDAAGQDAHGLERGQRGHQHETQGRERLRQRVPGPGDTGQLARHPAEVPERAEAPGRRRRDAGDGTIP